LAASSITNQVNQSNSQDRVDLMVRVAGFA
jgi:hypothetical protein